jgi:transcriptional regulator with PAS, ATPase and Fis domain
MQALSQFRGLESLESIIDCLPLSDAIALMATQSQDLIHANDQEKFASKHFWAIANIISFKIKHRIFLKERWSEYKWLLTPAIAHKHPTGKPARLIGVSVDITSCVEAKEEQLAFKKSEECFRILPESMSQEVWNAQENHGIISHISKQREYKLAQEALKHSEKCFRNLVEASSDWLWKVDENIVYTYISPKIRDILGYKPTEVLGKTPFDSNCKKVCRYSSS